MFQWILLLEYWCSAFSGVLFFGIILFAFTTIFSFITLPVEINASKRALVWLSASGITSYENHAFAQDRLNGQHIPML